ncbi:MAG: RNA recognition motif domain-containing protein, partial [Candidatus Acidiferrales bacterium]
MKKLYVGNLPFQASETELQELFTNAGITVTTITLVRDRQTGDPRGFGFVEIASDEEAERAIQSLNGQELLGRRLVVNEARPPRERG